MWESRRWRDPTANLAGFNTRLSVRKESVGIRDSDPVERYLVYNLVKVSWNVCETSPLYVLSRNETNMGTEMQHVVWWGMGGSVSLATCGL